jgi:3-dehydroquinate dehydratase-2
MPKVLVIHGPNLNLLGERETGIYGETTLEDINKSMISLARQHGVEIRVFQSNCEGDIINILHREGRESDCIIINPAAYTHYSIAIRDAVKSINVPVIEVHLSNIYSREDFRHVSVVAPVAAGQISGFGSLSYRLAVYAAIDMIKQKSS